MGHQDGPIEFDSPSSYDPEDLVDSWLANSEAILAAHAVERYARHAPELGWASILAVLDLPDAQAHLAVLADSLRILISRFGEAFIDRIEAEASISAAFRNCLGLVRPDPAFPIPESLWARLSAAAGCPIGPMTARMASLHAEMPGLSEVASWDPDPLNPDEAPTLSPDELAEQARGWLQYHQSFWAWEEVCRIHEDDGWEAVWPLLLAIVAKGDEQALGAIGAGLLEDILDESGPEVIGEIEREAATDQKFRYALSHVWQGDIPGPLWARVVAARGTEPQRG